MDLLELLSSNFDRIAAYLKDLARFILKPGEYLHNVATESGFEVACRLAFYAVGFTILGLSILSVAPAIPEVLAVTVVIGVAGLEVALGLLYFPAFVLVGKYLRLTAPAKYALIYCLTFRFVYLTIPIVFYALFLMTEDYLFAGARGVTSYAFFLAYVLVLPISLSARLRQRILATSLSVFFSVAILVSLTLISGFTETRTSGADRLSIFYDPIGAEVDALDLSDELLGPDGELKTWYTRFEQVISSTEREEGISLLSAVLEEWSARKGHWRSQLDRRIEYLAIERLSARFSTTRHLVELAIVEAQAEDDLLDSIETAFDRPSTEAVLSVLRNVTFMQEAQLAKLEAWSEHVAVRTTLNRLRLLAY